MAYPPILVDSDGNPIPQRWNEGGNKWEPYEGLILGPDGNPIAPATETTLGAVKTAVESIAEEDFATQTTLAALKTEIDKLTALISDSRLKTEATLTGRLATGGFDVNWNRFLETVAVSTTTTVVEVEAPAVIDALAIRSTEETGDIRMMLSQRKADGTYQLLDSYVTAALTFSFSSTISLRPSSHPLFEDVVRDSQSNEFIARLRDRLPCPHGFRVQVRNNSQVDGKTIYVLTRWRKLEE